MARTSLLLLVLPRAVFVGADSCVLPDGYSEHQLEVLRVQNCRKISEANQSRKLREAPHWKPQLEVALQRCRTSMELAATNQTVEAAAQAVYAWGNDMMNGTECCTLPHPPFCLDQDYSRATMAIAVLFGLLFFMFLAAGVASCFLRTVKREPQAPDQAELAPSALTMLSVPQRGNSLALELQGRWLEASCLRVLPGAEALAPCCASLFEALRERFGFQADNVRNQFEHLLSLWRSHCSMVADRSVEEGVQVDEETLLVKALRELHTELLEGFIDWRQKFHGVEEEPAGLPQLGGAQWSPFAEQKLSHYLAELAAYLLVWGEAGNVRFMPEVVYFLTDQVLTAEDAGPAGLYGTSAAGVSGQFLARVIRPIYNVIFDEWYEYVDIDEKSKKDKKKLHQGYDRFLPADVANYDDWDEFFCDPKRLSEGLLLEDGRRLFDLPRSQRFTALPRVDWAVSLDRFETKSHREVHSLWGVWASTHRIWLAHLLLFCLALCTVAGNPPHSTGTPLGGTTAPVRFAAVGLLVPLHGLMWGLARAATSGRALRRRLGRTCCSAMAYGLLWSLPLLSYAAVRYTEVLGLGFEGKVSLGVHLFVSVAGLASQMLVPARWPDRLWELTRARFRMRVVRYAFWLMILSVKFLLCIVIIRSMYRAMAEMGVVLVGRQSLEELGMLYYSTAWGASFLEWVLLWATTFFLFLADTQMWFVLGCTVLGVSTTLVQRRCMLAAFASEDAVAKIPERFSHKVLTYAPPAPGEHNSRLSPIFPLIWDRVVEYMRYEDKCDNQAMGDLSFYALAGDASNVINWKQLELPLRRRRPHPPARGPEASSERHSVKVPEIFRAKSTFERGFKHYCGVPDPSWPKNLESQWRFVALARSLGLPMPRPFRVPYVPGITVLIPHYGESIIMEKNELYGGKEQEEGRVPLMDWLWMQYEDEFRMFSNRKSHEELWSVESHQWEDYREHQWEKICTWASMRMQTLWRTVAGLTLYHAVLQCHYEAQADRTASLAREGIWKPSDVFTCMVSMQMYTFFNAVQLQQTNKLLEKFPDSLKVAFIDYEDKREPSATADGLHPRQRRRYFSCLVDRGCPQRPDGRRVPRYRVELPGFPILGDGKGDNQNHAIPFMRGLFAQCIDSNQGAYFEQMLLLPCVLGEFRTHRCGDGRSKKLVGLPEHITSDIGSIGDFAAGSEMAFGTILQRSYSVLGARMHYGHPDIMNKQFMMQQGGVSKATKTLNLSEDIFAGMDFTLRGHGRQIKHCEYLHLAKGRDLGFNSVLVFFSKLSSGAGEQILTRQMFRLGQVLHLPECLSFYYAHVGYYITQFFVSWSMPLVVFTWLLALTADCEDSLRAFQSCGEDAAAAMAKSLSVWYSWVLLLFLVATSMPLFCEVWMQRSLGTALIRVLKQFATCSFLHFIFQAKIIGYYVINELRYGGATYMPTGRGLPTERRPFIGTLVKGTGATMETVGGLYLDYAMHTYYDGMFLLVGVGLVLAAGGASTSGAGSLVMTWVSVGLTIVSWLLAPFLFNPYQFSLRYFKKDLRAWFSFFFSERGRHWIVWYDRQQLQPRTGLRHTIIDINFCLVYFWGAVWFATMNNKLYVLDRVYGSNGYIAALHMLTLAPPVVSSLVYCCLVTVAGAWVGCSSVAARSLRKGRGRLKKALAARRKQSQDSGDGSSSSSDSDSEEEPDFQRAGSDFDVPQSSSEEDSLIGCCPSGLHLLVSAGVVTVLLFLEAVAPLYVLRTYHFDKAFIAGLMLKFVLYCVVAVFMEGVLRSRCFPASRGFGQPIDLWVHANRMARDFLTSLFLLCLLLPLVALNSLNDHLCAGCSAHQLLIYRSPGHLNRQTAEVGDVIYIEDGLDTYSPAPPAPPARPAPPPPLISMPPSYSAGAPPRRTVP